MVVFFAGCSVEALDERIDCRASDSLEGGREGVGGIEQ